MRDSQMIFDVEVDEDGDIVDYQIYFKSTFPQAKDYTAPNMLGAAS